MVMDFSNSMIYLPGITGPGDFLEPISTLTSNYTIGSSNFWLVATSSYDERRFFFGATHSVIEKKYFEITTINPGSVPNIQFTNGKTSRRYSRILKYKIDNLGDIFITSNLDSFDTTTGLGEGDKLGYALCDGQNNTYDLRGRYILGYDKSSPDSPTDLTTTSVYGGIIRTDQENYGKIGNFGGGLSQSGESIPTVSPVAKSNLPVHTHTTGPTTLNGARHGHIIPVSKRSAICFAENETLISEQRRIGPGNSEGDGTEGTITRWETHGIANYENSPLRNHTHSVNYDGGYDDHETRPPYIILAYYQKI
jgi:hypothetical protein